MQAPPRTRWLALSILVSLVAMPFGHAADAATLNGAIVRSQDRAPLVGARLHVGDPKTGEVFSSDPTGKDGSFELGALPAATYELAVEADGGLYVVEAPLAVAPGSVQTLNLAVSRTVDAKKSSDPRDLKGHWSIKENPLTAALAFVGIVVVLGAILAGGDSNSRPASPSQVQN